MRNNSSHPKSLDLEGGVINFGIIGSGFSGLCIAIKLLENGFDSFDIFEKESEAGGTWYLNSYPGCGCDVPSHLYSFSFELNPNWSRTYARQEEIHEYILFCIDKYNLKDKIRYNSGINSMNYDSQTRKWTLIDSNGSSHIKDVVISGTGGLNIPSKPALSGLESFKGAVFHTAEWDHTVKLVGKKVGIIGTGASAIQVAPEICNKVEELTIFQRTPSWVVPKPDFIFPNSIKKLFGLWKGPMKLFRYILYLTNESFAPGFTRFPILLSFIQPFVKLYIYSQIKDPDLRKKVTPDYTIGCKRISPSSNYYQTLAKKNVHLHTDGIDSINPTGITDQNNNNIPLDVIILATGFKATEYLSNIEVKANKMPNLFDFLKSNKGPSYLGTMVSGYPNLFLMTGPNTGLGHNSMIHIIESQSQFILSALLHMKENNYREINVKKSAEQAYTHHIHSRLKNTVWQKGGCTSWYQTENGHNSTLLPHSTIWYRKKTKRIKAVDFNFED